MIVLFVFIVLKDPLRKVPVKPETHRFTPYQAWHFPERSNHLGPLRLTSRNARPDRDTRFRRPGRCSPLSGHDERTGRKPAMIEPAQHVPPVTGKSQAEHLR